MADMSKVDEMTMVDELEDAVTQLRSRIFTGDYNAALDSLVDAQLALGRIEEYLESEG